jgi:glycosyltransferase involved in cell wall biosynthesis
MSRQGNQAAKDDGVTIVIPCFNQGSFLAEALDSIYSQKLLPQEIIVINDGSTDHSSAVARRYDGVRLIEQSNRGVAAARNVGLKMVHTAFVVFLDADDRLMQNALEVGLKAMKSQAGLAFAFGGFRRINLDGKPIGAPQSMNYRKNHYQTLLQSNHVGMVANVILNSCLARQAGGFNPELSACEDYDLFLRLAREHPVTSHQNIVAEYRQHPSSLSANHILMLRNALQVIELQKEHYSGDKALMKAARQGHRNWTEYYGQKIWRDAAIDFTRLDFAAATGKIRALWNITFYLPLIWLVRSIIRHLFKRDAGEEMPDR